MDYNYLIAHAELFPSAIGITHHQFEKLLPKFSFNLRLAESRRRVILKRFKKPGAGRPATLATDRQKLFFILLYYKVYPTFRLAQLVFKFDKRNIQLWVRFLEPVLQQSIDYQLKLPVVKAKHLHYWTEVCPALKEFIVDATERPIRRPKDDHIQRHYYSGKRQTHTVKNQLLVHPKTKRILSISQTVEGKRHDKQLMADDPTSQLFPPNTIGMGDTAYQAAERLHPWLKMIIPMKKPKKKELTDTQKTNNTAISRIRVRAEHPIAYLKHFNILTHEFRNNLNHAHQPFQTIACLYNFTRNIR